MNSPEFLSSRNVKRGIVAGAAVGALITSELVTAEHADAWIADATAACEKIVPFGQTPNAIIQAINLETPNETIDLGMDFTFKTKNGNTIVVSADNVRPRETRKVLVPLTQERRIVNAELTWEDAQTGDHFNNYLDMVRNDDSSVKDIILPAAAECTEKAPTTTSTTTTRPVTPTTSRPVYPDTPPAIPVANTPRFTG